MSEQIKNEMTFKQKQVNKNLTTIQKLGEENLKLLEEIVDLIQDYFQEKKSESLESKK